MKDTNRAVSCSIQSPARIFLPCSVDVQSIAKLLHFVIKLLLSTGVMGQDFCSETNCIITVSLQVTVALLILLIKKKITLFSPKAQ